MPEPTEAVREKATLQPGENLSQQFRTLASGHVEFNLTSSSGSMTVVVIKKSDYVAYSNGEPVPQLYTYRNQTEFKDMVHFLEGFFVVTIICEDPDPCAFQFKVIRNPR